MTPILNFLKEIPGYSDYYVNEYGEVFSKKRGEFRQLKHRISDSGYCLINLKGKGLSIHRLVALAWLENVPNKHIVNHIDGNKSNNNVDNLVWVTSSENNYHSKNILKNKQYTIPVVQCTLNGELIEEFSSIQEASNKTGIYHGNISFICKNKGRQAGGFLWKYKKDFVEGERMREHTSYRKVGQYDENNNLIKIFISCKDGARFINTNAATFRYVCKHENFHKGYYWKYMNDPKKIPNETILDTNFWAIIDEFPKYKISRDGRVFSLYQKKELKSFLSSGYKTIKLVNKIGRKNSMSIHRLVALAYLPNPSEYPCVNHIDGNKINNCIENLQWCSYRANIQHAHDTGLHKHKNVIQLNLRGIELNKFLSVKKASKKTGIGEAAISKCCRGESKTSGGYIWRYGDL